MENMKMSKEETTTIKDEKYSLPAYAEERLNKIKDSKQKLRYKITLARKLFLNQKKDKSGSNKFQNFDYFELKDIVPDAIEICCVLGLEYDFILSKRWGKLIVSDVESDAEIVYPKERPQIREGGNINQQLQSIGKTSTYLKRYCLMDFLEVVEADKVDAQDNSEKSKSKKPTLKKQMVLDDVKAYLFEHLDDPSDYKTARKLLNDLKLNKKINQAVFNKMSADLDKAEKSQ